MHVKNKLTCYLLHAFSPLDSCMNNDFVTSQPKCASSIVPHLSIYLHPPCMLVCWLLGWFLGLYVASLVGLWDCMLVHFFPRFVCMLVGLLVCL